MQAFHIITRGMRLIGALAANEVPKASEARDGFNALNDMVDAFALETLLVYVIATKEYVLAPGKADYTIGAVLPVDWLAASRPTGMGIRNMTVIPVSAPDQPELPLDMLDADEWANVRLKSTGSTFPTMVRYEPSMPNGTLLFWPVPTEAAHVKVYQPSVLQKFRDLTTEYDFPPGYARMIAFNLASELAAEFGRPVPPEVETKASEYKGNVKRGNISTQDSTLRVDEALLTRGGRFDYRTGDSR